ncbi:hypothetical protein KBY30_19030 [Ruegeria pomeroyi]|nr:hypothetical protein [Ruegeria pomeroyi]
MDRRSFITSGLVLTLWTGTAWAQSGTEAITRQLKAQGYTSVEVSRTLLGRARIVAKRPGEQREIIVNPRTGEILRDYWQGNRNNGGGLLNRSTENETETENEAEADDGSGQGRGRGRGRGGDDSSSGSGSDGDDGGDDGGNSGHGGGDDGDSGSGGDGDD